MRENKRGGEKKKKKGKKKKKKELSTELNRGPLILRDSSTIVKAYLADTLKGPGESTVQCSPRAL